MNVQFKIENRKELVKVIEELILEKAKYLGVPSCAYQIGGLTLSKDSKLTWNEEVNETAVQNLVNRIVERGFEMVQENNEPEVVGFMVAMPRSLFTPESWENLNNLLSAKGSLIQKALALETLPEVIEEDDKVTFPWFKVAPNEPEVVEAYSRFVAALVKMAKEQKRVTAKAHPVDNEKFAFRCFLLRLGFIGSEYKTVRKVLLKNLTGSSAFKGGHKNEISDQGNN